MRHWKFRRQHQIEGFILDFYCPRLRLCIELDGEPHFDESGRRYDALRTRRLADIGILVLRIENRDIIANPEITSQEIEKALEMRASARLDV